jgi:hypothetical protein
MFVPAKGFAGLPRVCAQQEAVIAIRTACEFSLVDSTGKLCVEGGGYDLCTALQRLAMKQPNGNADGYFRIKYAGSGHAIRVRSCDLPPLVNFGIGLH